MLLHRSDLTRSTDTADTLLRRLGVSDPEASAFLRKDPVARTILGGRPGKMLRAVTEATPGGGELQELLVRGPHGTTPSSAAISPASPCAAPRRASLPPASRCP